MVDDAIMEKLAEEIDELEFPTTEFERLQYREKSFMILTKYRVFEDQFEDWLMHRLDLLWDKEKQEKNLII
jgi:hypothetical protein